MNVNVYETCEFIGTVFILKTTHRIGNCNKRLLTLLCVSVFQSERRCRTRHVQRAFPNKRFYPLIYVYVSEAGSVLTNIQESFW
jgi:hypothetical protein